MIDCQLQQIIYKLKYYIDPEGQSLFTKWLNSLKDKQALSKIAARLLRLENGNFGDCKPVGEGVWELRIDSGPGYRVYYTIEGKRVILLCDVCDKSTQTTDIKNTISRWNERQTRGK